MITNTIASFNQLLLLSFFILGSVQSYGQIDGLEIIPEDSIHTDLSYNNFNLTFIHLKNNRTDSLFLRWEKTHSEFVDDWYVTLCDNVYCYGVVPDGAEMYGIAPSDSVYIRMEVNPYEVDAFGEIHIQLSEMDADPELTETLKYSFSTKNFTSLSTEALPEKGLTSYPNPFREELILTNPFTEDLNVRLIDMSGQLLKQLWIAPGQSEILEVRDLPAGMLHLNYCYEENCYSKLIIHIR